MTRAALLYRHSCRKCRVLSAAAVLLSLGTIRRIPLDSSGAEDLYRRFPQTRGKLALVDGPRSWLGWEVFGGAIVTVCRRVAGVPLPTRFRQP